MPLPNVPSAATRASRRSARAWFRLPATRPSRGVPSPAAHTQRRRVPLHGIHSTSPWWPGRVDVIAVLVTASLALAHALAVAPSYHVGSFDDDASYLMAARALAHGVGLGGMLPAGYPLVATYPPGYPLLLSPVAAVAGAALWPYRAVTLACYLLLFPLTHRWLVSLRAPRWLRIGTLVLLALNPVLATYATMVMAEVPVMVATLVLFLVAARWSGQRRLLGPAAFGAVACAAALLWLKEAEMLLVGGVVLWFAVRREIGKAAVTAVGTAALFVPILVLRATAGTPLVGARYGQEISGNASLGAVPRALGTYLTTALPNSVVPLIGTPHYVFAAVAASVPVLVVIGAVVWLRRHRDVAGVAALVYLLATLAYPYINERRVLLVLPVVLSWYLLGAQILLRAVAAALARTIRRPVPGRPAIAAACCALVVVPLAWQFPRNYRLHVGEQTSRMLGSAYLRFAAVLTGPRDVIETPYQWTTSLGTGRRTANGVFQTPCDPAGMRRAALDAGAGFVVDGAFNFVPPNVDCEHVILDAAPWAVRLYRTPLDDAAVYELLGPGTVHPSLADAATGAAATTRIGPGQTAASDTWRGVRRVVQLSLAAAGARGGATRAVRLEWRSPDGGWHVAAGAPGPVGPQARIPFLLWRPTNPVAATGVRVVTVGGTGASVEDLHALVAQPR